MLLNGHTFRILITNNSHSTAAISMDMATLLEIARKKQKKKLKKRRFLNGFMFRKQALPNNILEQKAKEEIQGMEPFMWRRKFINLKL